MSERKPLIKEYANEDIKVLWQPRKCIHSARCLRALPGVFDVERRPWIELEHGTTAQIKVAVEQCPSGALSWVAVQDEQGGAGDPAPADRAAAGEDAPAPVAESVAATRVQLLANGPLLVQGAIDIIDAEGVGKREAGPTALCRCGHSARKPYCDGSHTRVGFKSGE